MTYSLNPEATAFSYTREDFFANYAYYIPPVMMKLSNKPCYKTFYTYVHYNFS